VLDLAKGEAAVAELKKDGVDARAVKLMWTIRRTMRL
jgi:hypothetical protein